MSDDLLTTALREEISSMLTRLKQDIASSKPPEVQELVLAQRHLEDARMRLGVAEAYHKGLDPWAAKVADPAAPDSPDAEEKADIEQAHKDRTQNA